MKVFLCYMCDRWANYNKDVECYCIHCSNKMIVTDIKNSRLSTFKLKKDIVKHD